MQQNIHIEGNQTEDIFDLGAKPDEVRVKATFCKNHTTKPRKKPTQSEIARHLAAPKQRFCLRPLMKFTPKEESKEWQTQPYLI